MRAMPAIVLALLAVAGAPAPATAQDKLPDGAGTGTPGASTSQPDLPFTLVPEDVREMVGVWRGRIPTQDPGYFRDVGVELKLKEQGLVSVVYLWGPGADPSDDPSGIARGDGVITFDGKIEFKFMQNPPYEITLIMSYDAPDELIVLWNELDTEKLRLRRMRMQLRRVLR